MVDVGLETVLGNAVFDTRLALVVGLALIGTALLLLWFGYFDGWAEGRAAFGGALFGALIGFVGIIYAASLQAEHQRAENDRLRGEDQRARALALWTDSHQAIAELVVLMNELRDIERTQLLNERHLQWINERGFIAAHRANELLRGNLERSSGLPTPVVALVSRAAFAAAMLEVNISTIRIGPTHLRIADIRELLRPVEEAIRALIEAGDFLRAITKVDLAPQAETQKLLAIISSYREAHPFDAH